MQIPFDLNTLKLEDDRLQSLSAFYNVLKKLKRFSAQISNPRCQLLVENDQKNRVQNAQTFEPRYKKRSNFATGPALTLRCLN